MRSRSRPAPVEIDMCRKAFILLYVMQSSVVTLQSSAHRFDLLTTED